MAKCNILGRGEARSLSKLDKAKEKIKKLKTRVQELEIAVEAKDNEVLRALKFSKKASSKMDKCSLENQIKEPAEQKISLDCTESMQNDPFCPTKRKRLKPSKDIGLNNITHDKSLGVLGQEMGSYIFIDEDASGISTFIEEDVAIQKCYSSRPRLAFDTESEAQLHGESNKDGFSDSRCASKGDMATTPLDATDEDVELLHDDITQCPPLLRIKRETPLPIPVSQPDRCFSGGLLGPDGTNWHLGKWCKRVQNKGSTVSSVAMQGSTRSTGDLIAIGADGKGGRIKVLRSLNQSSRNSKETTTWVKRGQYGAKTNALQSQGCLQIEHFFGKAGQ
ncbi:unnamed protein product [Ilex paraguariensis]|uniref:Uncharacterized protein n=1 Tax=Ilex paraguariensis TaxID=185542 RepID=A0ABC8SHQ2_9AQUA